MRHLLALMAATVSVAACAPSPERLNEAQGDLLRRAYHLQPAAMTAASDSVYADLRGGWGERGAPARPPLPGVTIIYLDLDADTFEMARTANAKWIYGGEPVQPKSITNGFVLNVYNVCIVYQVRVGDVGRRHDGLPLFIVTPRIHADVREHETRHCHGQSHDANNVWLP